MSTAPDPSPPPTPATVDATDAASAEVTQLSADLKTTLSTADISATQSLQTLLQVHQARLSQMTRAATSLTAASGAANPRVVSAEAAVAASTATVARLSILNQQLGTPAPQVAATGWVLHGRVFTAQSQPAANYTVFLVDGQKAYQQQYGFAYTDSTGYFLLSYAGAAPQNTGAAAQNQTTAQLFLEIVNQDAKAVFLSTTAFQPALGSATYQNLILPAGEPPLGDPPQAIRNVAFPSQNRKS